jgi:hypothetical protein
MAVTTKQLIRKLDSKIEYPWREYIRFQTVVEHHPSEAGGDHDG